MENNGLTLGSLFDGSGGFPLGGVLCGITPIWSSEIEPFAIRVTTKRFPSVIHYGDVSKLNGAELPPVDIITFGSPCQDMSIAGSRKGLDGARSVLFFDAVRIIKEMREKTNGRYPRFIVWENVPGAFSSNGGDDFKAVLEEIASVKGLEINTVRPPKWPNAGEIVADDFSLAWRLFDAQYWGVPQRRKRIYLVADFADGCAGKILFESEGLSGYTPQGFRSWQDSAGDAHESTSEAGIGIDGYNGSVSKMASTLGVNCGMSTGRNGVMVLNDQGGERMDVSKDKTSTLRAESHHPPLVFENHSQDTRYRGPLDVAQTVLSTYGTGGNNQPFVLETPKTLKIRSGCEGGGKGPLIQDDKSATLGCNNDQTLFVPTAFGVCSKTSHSMLSDNPKSGFYEAETSRTLDTGGGNPTCNQGGIAVVEGNGIRPSHKGDGYKESDVMYTLNATEQHAVAFADKHAAISAADGPKGPSSQMLGNPEENFVAEPAFGIDRASYNMGTNAKFGMVIESEVEPTMVAKGPGAVAHPVYTTSKNSYHTEAEEDVASTLVATDYKDPPTVFEDPYYIVRRLTPVECARLQGFPDWWCMGLETEAPTVDDLNFWREVFDTYSAVCGTGKKTDAQILKWLKDPHSDSAEYKLWGNGVALPNVHFVLSGIVYYAQIPDFLL